MGIGAVCLIDTIHTFSPLHIEPQTSFLSCSQKHLIILFGNFIPTRIPVYPHKPDMVELLFTLKLDDPFIHAIYLLVVNYSVWKSNNWQSGHFPQEES